MGSTNIYRIKRPDGNIELTDRVIGPGEVEIRQTDGTWHPVPREASRPKMITAIPR